MKRRFYSMILLGIFLLTGLAQAGTVSAGTSLFQAGRWRGSFSAGSGQGNGDAYIVAGLGVGYFLVNRLEAGFDGEAWIGSSPQLYKLTPGLRYVYSGFEKFWPYVGAFYRRTVYDGLPDLSSYGGRYGVYVSVAPNAYAGVGGVYEQLANCDEHVYDSCSSSYPEISISLSF